MMGIGAARETLRMIVAGQAFCISGLGTLAELAAGVVTGVALSRR
ncbi:hypothetical protein [Nonomuraea composti]|nr:hypothetical protein [Nonomuraea sp. FMUSA5-5]